MITNENISISQIVSQNEGNIVSDMDGEKVMLSIHNGKYYNLGEIGGEIWELIEKPISIQEVITTLLSQYDVTQEQCEEQVLSFLSLLKTEGLIEIQE